MHFLNMFEFSHKNRMLLKEFEIVYETFSKRFGALILTPRRILREEGMTILHACGRPTYIVGMRVARGQCTNDATPFRLEQSFSLLCSVPDDILDLCVDFVRRDERVVRCPVLALSSVSKRFHDACPREVCEQAISRNGSVRNLCRLHGTTVEEFEFERELCLMQLDATSITLMTNFMSTVPYLRIEHLDMSSCVMGDEGIHAFSRAGIPKDGNRGFPLLKYLNIKDNQIHDRGFVHVTDVLRVGGFPMLSVFVFSHNEIGSHGIRDLSRCIESNVVDLQSVDLIFNCVQPDGTNAFLRSMLPNARVSVLRMSFTHDDEEMLTLTDVIRKGGLRYLTSLTIAKNVYSSNAMTNLSSAILRSEDCDIGRLPCLQELYLLGNEIEENGAHNFVNAIAQGALESLKEIDIDIFIDSPIFEEIAEVCMHRVIKML